jgi:predicted nucleotidyltransferase
MNDGLSERQRAAIVSVLSTHPRVTRAVLFGSRALGVFQPASDIDLALFGEQLTISDLAKLRVALEEHALPMAVDLVVYNQITNQNLRQHIDEKGIDFFHR